MFNSARSFSVGALAFSALLTPGFASAAVYLAEDFEDPDVTTASQQFPTDTAAQWLSNQSFNGFRKYIVDENVTFSAGNSSGSFTTPDGEQGYTFGYNAQVGMTTAEGALRSFDAAGTMTLDFLWGRTTDETDPANVFITFYAFNPDTTANGDRDNQADQNPGGTQNVDWVRLGERTGYSSTSSVLSAYQHQVVLLDPSTGYATDISGWDLALRVGGANFEYGVVDDLELDITLVTDVIPEPASALLLTIVSGMLFTRRRR